MDHTTIQIRMAVNTTTVATDLPSTRPHLVRVRATATAPTTAPTTVAVVATSEASSRLDLIRLLDPGQYI